MIIFGASRIGWRWYGWVQAPLSTNGTWFPTGLRYPFRWMALMAASRLAYGAVRATVEQVRRFETATHLHPENWPMLPIKGGKS